MTKYNELTPEKKLMYNLIFDTKTEYEIDLFEYIHNIKDINPFTERVLDNLKKSGIRVREEFLVLTDEKNVWILRLIKK